MSNQNPLHQQASAVAGNDNKPTLLEKMKAFGKEKLHRGRARAPTADEPCRPDTASSAKSGQTKQGEPSHPPSHERLATSGFCTVPTSNAPPLLEFTVHDKLNHTLVGYNSLNKTYEYKDRKGTYWVSKPEVRRGVLMMVPPYATTDCEVVDDLEWVIVGVDSDEDTITYRDPRGGEFKTMPGRIRGPYRRIA